MKSALLITSLVLLSSLANAMTVACPCRFKEDGQSMQIYKNKGGKSFCSVITCEKSEENAYVCGSYPKSNTWIVDGDNATNTYTAWNDEVVTLSCERDHDFIDKKLENK